MSAAIRVVTDAGELAPKDVDALLALEAATQDRPLALTTLLAEIGPLGTVLLARHAGPEAAGVLVGFASARLLVDEAHVIRLAVDATDRRRGIGRALLDGLIDWAREGGASAVVLEVRADNVAASTLYRAVGFTQDGLRPRYYPDGEDARLLRLPLAVPGPTTIMTPVAPSTMTSTGGM